MKRITHFKGYASSIDFDPHSQTFHSKRQEMPALNNLPADTDKPAEANKSTAQSVTQPPKANRVGIMLKGARVLILDDNNLLSKGTKRPASRRPTTI